MSAEPGVQDLTVYQGAHWSQTILWEDSDETPVDLTGYTARMQVRETVTTEGDPIVELTDGDGITLSYVAGPPEYNILLELTAAQTAALPATPSSRKWRYDLEVVPASGEVRRLLMGKFIVSLEVTR